MKKRLLSLAIVAAIAPLTVAFAAPDIPVNDDDDVAKLTQSSSSEIGGATTTINAIVGTKTDADEIP